MKETSTIKDMFDNIAERYDFLNHTLSIFQDYYWRYQMFNEVVPAREVLVLDIATGTGDSAKVSIKNGFKVVGIDLSYKMLYKTKKKIKSDSFVPICGSGYELPFKNESFSVITCAFGIRNMHETIPALKEINRVLKNGGKVIFLEFSMPKTLFKYPYRIYLKYVMPFIASFFSRKEAYDYLYDSIEKFPRPDDFAQLLKEASFTASKTKSLSFGTVNIITAFK